METCSQVVIKELCQTHLPFIYCLWYTYKWMSQAQITNRAVIDVSGKKNVCNL